MGIKLASPYTIIYAHPMGFPGDSVVKSFGSCSFDPWVGEMPLEKEMATHSTILAWKISWTEEPGELLFTGSPKSWT